MTSKLNQLYLMELFIAIVQKGSFSGAAKLLNVAAAKASKDIHYLEASLDCMLLNRTTRALNVTDAGEIYYQSALDIVEMQSQMRDNLAILKNNISGELRITAPALWGEVVLAPIIIAYRQKFPLVKFSANFSNETLDILRENIHIAFRSTNLKDEPYLARYISDDEFVLCASKTYLANHSIPTQPKELVDLHLISLAGSNGQFEQIEFIHKSQSIHQHLQSELQFNNKQVIYEAVKAGLGYAVLPKYLVLKELACNEIVEILPTYQIKSSTFYALYTQRRKDSALVNHFIDYVSDKIHL